MIKNTFCISVCYRILFDFSEVSSNESDISKHWMVAGERDWHNAYS